MSVSLARVKLYSRLTLRLLAHVYQDILYQDLSVYVVLKTTITYLATLVELFPLTLLEILPTTRDGLVMQATMHGVSAVTLVLLYVLLAALILNARLVRALLRFL